LNLLSTKKYVKKISTKIKSRAVAESVKGERGQ